MTGYNERLWQGRLSRRDFLWLMAASGVGISGLQGCAVDPVTGKKEFVLMSKQQEIDLDKENAPHQFSEDYGAVEDPALNRYVAQVGKSMSGLSHRPDMPYSYRAVNATYVNAYAFPGGSIAVTRGILLEMENEAELAALLGHEIGHVNGRHSAERAAKSTLAGALVGLGSLAAASSGYQEYAPLIQSVGGVGAGALLSKYSRDNEREADALGVEYMHRAQQNPSGMVGLMEMLRSMSSKKPSAIEQMFSSHPMSDERYKTAKNRVREKQYAQALKRPAYRDRYMDNTAGVRKIKGAIQNMQKSEAASAKGRFDLAGNYLSRALRDVPGDYAALVMSAKNELAQEKPKNSVRFAKLAMTVSPREAQAHHLMGLSLLMQNKPDAAYAQFQSYEKLLPGNPGTIFLRATAAEGMQNKKLAANEYQRYLNASRSGAQASHAYQRLVDWGYIAPAKR